MRNDSEIGIGIDRSTVTASSVERTWNLPKTDPSIALPLSDTVSSLSYVTFASAVEECAPCSATDALRTLMWCCEAEEDTNRLAHGQVAPKRPPHRCLSDASAAAAHFPQAADLALVQFQRSCQFWDPTTGAQFAWNTFNEILHRDVMGSRITPPPISVRHDDLPEVETFPLSSLAHELLLLLGRPVHIRIRGKQVNAVFHALQGRSNYLSLVSTDTVTQSPTSFVEDASDVSAYAFGTREAEYNGPPLSCKSFVLNAIGRINGGFFRSGVSPPDPNLFSLRVSIHCVGSRSLFVWDCWRRGRCGTTIVPHPCGEYSHHQQWYLERVDTSEMVEVVREDDCACQHKAADSVAASSTAAIASTTIPAHLISPFPISSAVHRDYPSTSTHLHSYRLHPVHAPELVAEASADLTTLTLATPTSSSRQIFQFELP